MTNADKARAMSQRRVLRLQMILAGHAADGLRLHQIAEAVQCSRATTLRDLQVMAEEGFAERLPDMDDRWRLSPRAVQIWAKHQAELQRLDSKLKQLNQRYSADPT